MRRVSQPRSPVPAQPLEPARALAARPAAHPVVDRCGQPRSADPEDDHHRLGDERVGARRRRDVHQDAAHDRRHDGEQQHDEGERMPPAHEQPSAECDDQCDQTLVHDERPERDGLVDVADAPLDSDSRPQQQHHARQGDRSQSPGSGASASGERSDVQPEDQQELRRNRPPARRCRARPRSWRPGGRR